MSQSLYTSIPLIFGSLISLFISIDIIAYCHAKCCKINDFFKPTALIVCLFQLLDVLTDIYFTVDVYNLISSDSHIKILFISSVAFIIIPIVLSLFQLHYATKKHFLHDNKIRAWLNDHSNLLYITSILSGSSFAAIKIFNSNLLSLNICDMGLTRKHLSSFYAKRVYSTILFENLPQIALQTWYIIYHNDYNMSQITILSLGFSFISICATFISVITTKRIYSTQSYVQITFNVTGKSVVKRTRKCRNRIKTIRSSIGAVLGINPKLIEIQRPHFTRNGLTVKINVLVLKKVDPNDPENPDFDGLITDAMKHGKLADIMTEAWKLSDTPGISDLTCEYIDSKQEINENKLKLVKIVSADEEEDMWDCMRESLEMSINTSSSVKIQKDLCESMTLSSNV